MVRIAIDLDGCAFDWPDEFTRLATCLCRGGATVVFLTAAGGDLPSWERPIEVVRRIKQHLPHIAHLPVVCCESSEKAEWLVLNGFDILIDGTDRQWGGLQLIPGAKR